MIPRKYLIPAIFILLLPVVLSPIAGTPVSADIGPKPWMDFPIDWGSSEPQTITSVILYTCSDPDCPDTRPLEELGPQGISCESSQMCSSLAYSYDDYFILELTLDSGATLASSTVEFAGSGTYPVTVNNTELIVNSPSPTMFERLFNIPVSRRGMGFEGLFGVGMVMVLLVLLLVAAVTVLGSITLVVILVRRSAEEPITFNRAKIPFILTWLASALFYLPAVLISPAVPLTILIEGTAAFLYALARRRDRLATITFVLLANLFTVPALMISAVLFNFGSLGPVILAAEILIWLVEAGILFVLQQRSIKLSEALLFSLGLNLLSFLTGLLLPV